jgi:CheY-like chemotaxis protein
MMGGNIDVRSGLGEGTTVQVSLPLVRPLPGSDSSQTTPRSTSTGATRDDSVQLLGEEAGNCVVAIYEHDEKDRKPASFRERNNVLANYVKDWYGLQVCDWADKDTANVLIIEERDISEVVHRDEEAGSKKFPALIVLCSNATRHSEAEADTSVSQLKGVFEYLSKPCGPYKLAKALRACLGRMQLLNSANQQVARESLATPEREGFQDLELPAFQDKGAPIAVQADGAFAASRVFASAQMANNISSASQKHHSNEFPFPPTRTSPTSSPLSPEVQNLSTWNEATPKISPVREAEKRGPRMLLVDDNKINLQLLQTFMHKRKYSLVDSAEDGNVAVNAVKAATEPYNIIFMGKQRNRNPRMLVGAFPY